MPIKVGEFFLIICLFVCLLRNLICPQWCKMTPLNSTDFIRQQTEGVCT